MYSRRHDHERHDHERHWEVHPSLLTHLIHLLRTYVNSSHKVSKRFKVEFYLSIVVLKSHTFESAASTGVYIYQ